jgi:hypothetical protein
LEPSIDLGFNVLSARLAGTVFENNRTTLSDGSGAEFTLWSVALSICGNARREQSHASLCAGMEVGQMNGRGFGALAVARAGSATWVTPIVQAHIVSAPVFFGLRGYIGALAGMPLVRRPFTFGEVEVVHRAEVIVGRLGAGLEIDWQ